MSQYPSPYQPPPHPNQYAYEDALGPARRAGKLMFVLAGLAVLAGFSCAGFGALMPEMLRQRPELFEQFQQIPNATPQLVRTLFFVLAGMIFVGGVVFGILAQFVRRGSRPAIILSLVVSGLVVLYLVLSALNAMAHGGGGMAGAQLACSLVMVVVPLALLGLLFIWLVQSLRTSGAAAAMQQQYAQQYWQYAYQQQMYNRTPPPGGAPVPPMPPPGQIPGIPTHGGFPPPPGYQPPAPPPYPQQQPPPTPPPGDRNGPPAQG